MSSMCPHLGRWEGGAGAAQVGTGVSGPCAATRSHRSHLGPSAPRVCAHPHPRGLHLGFLLPMGTPRGVLDSHSPLPGEEGMLPLKMLPRGAERSTRTAWPGGLTAPPAGQAGGSKLGQGTRAR